MNEREMVEELGRLQQALSILTRRVEELERKCAGEWIPGVVYEITSTEDVRGDE
jgi:hypothetical protein